MLFGILAMTVSGILAVTVFALLTITVSAIFKKDAVGTYTYNDAVSPVRLGHLLICHRPCSSPLI